jgi:Putative carbonic anhydrase
MADRSGDGKGVYESTLAWDATRPSAAIITCVDGRWYHHFQEFARVHLGAGTRTDYLAVPGGIEPMSLFDLVPKDFNFFRRRIEALVEAHGTRRIVAIAHQDCAWYKSRKIGRITDLREQQVSDLRRAAALLREWFPNVTVEIYFARLSGEDPQKVLFEAV